ncbi:hypothetical protein M405DRAFT_929009 [Rhizopogon salebrosus TDB-379]|nr:hypothetical protein M405DRAFT_929009 [Rhizopogon salebrosus TDB-379]
MSTPPVKLHSLWATKLELNVWALSTISLKVFAKRQIHEDQYVGMVQERVEALLANHRTKIYRLIPSDAHGDQLPPCASMEFKIMPLYGTIEPSMTRHVERQSAWTAGAPGGVSYSPNDAWNYIEPAVAAVVPVLPPLLEKIDMFVRLAGVFAEAHPYTKMAFMVLTAAYQVVHAQFERDGRVDRLITVMHDTYSLICDPEELKRMESQEETINFLARQTVECSYFIRHYKQNRSGLKKSISNALSTIDAKIQGYEATFKKLQNAIQAQAVIHAELYIVRNYDLLLDNAAKADFKDMHYAAGVSYKSYKVGSAPPGTDVMEITSWVNQDTGPQIYLLLGHNECEKSSIAHAIAHQFDAIMRLGSSYFFSCATQDKRNAMNLFSTIARHLAEHDPQYKKTLWDVVKDKYTIRETSDPVVQFTSCILAPAKQTACIGPVLVVIDGLEYSGNKTAHGDILTVLAEKGAELPPGFKFLITCRPDDSVCAAFEGKPHVLQKHSPDRISLHNSTSSLNSSNSGSAVSTLFDNDPDWDVESLRSSVDEEAQTLKKPEARVLCGVKKVITVEKRLYDTSGRHARRIHSQTSESWTVEQHDHP